MSWVRAPRWENFFHAFCSRAPRTKLCCYESLVDSEIRTHESTAQISFHVSQEPEKWLVEGIWIGLLLRNRQLKDDSGGNAYLADLLEAAKVDTYTTEGVQIRTSQVLQHEWHVLSVLVVVLVMVGVLVVLFVKVG